jgi:molybdopterin-guanine dinucleotide biosynthesis protein A
MTNAPPPQRAHPHAFILAGGEAKRMGGADKARLLLRGEPLLLHVARALRPSVSSITVIGRAPGAYADLGFDTLADSSPGAGPLSGLHRALTSLSLSDGLALLTPCDLDGLQPAWIDRLIAAATPDALAVAFCSPPTAGDETTADETTAAPRSRNPRGWEPLPALYSPRLLPEVCARLARGDAALWRLLDACGATPAPRPPPGGRGGGGNPPQDLARAHAPLPSDDP